MPVARLGTIALLLCSLPLFAQQPPSKSLTLPPNAYMGNVYAPNSAAEPWKILSNLPQEQNPAQVLQEHVPQFKADYSQLDRNARIFEPYSATTANTSSVDDEQDIVCYSIRSYVVARDKKDSDATHAVSESTCQPASRYGVHSADQQVKLSNGESIP